MSVLTVGLCIVGFVLVWKALDRVEEADGFSRRCAVGFLVSLACMNVTSGIQNAVDDSFWWATVNFLFVVMTASHLYANRLAAQKKPETITIREFLDALHKLGRS